MDTTLDPYSDATLQRMLEAVRPRWDLHDATSIPMGTNILYMLSVETEDRRRDCVLKACEVLNPQEFRPEPYLLTVLDRRTNVPVPDVVGVVNDHDDLPSPYFLMERCDGSTPDELQDHPTDLREHIAYDAGRYMGAYHTVGSFERFGSIRLGRDVDHQRTATRVDGQRITTADDGTDSWRTWFEGWVEYWLGELDDRFADLEPALRTFIENRIDALDASFTPVLSHHDYRFWNLLIDPDTGETKAVLDWANEQTVDPYYDILSTEQHLSGWAPLDNPVRRRIRTAIWEGYRETNQIEREQPFARRHELYLAVTRLPVLAWFSGWMADATEAKREATATTHRQYVDELVS